VRIVVIGGGPAGVATALSLRQLEPSWDLVLAHRPATGAWRPGETLAPGGRPLLESLGLWEAFRADNHPEAIGTRAAWGSDASYENEFLFSTHGPGWHLDRPRFDAMLLEAACRAGIGIAADPPARAAFTVDATGREASYAVSRGARRIADDNLIGVGRIIERPHGVPYTTVEARESGWMYTAPLPRNRTLEAWMTDPDLKRADDNWSGGTPAGIFSARSQHLSPCAGPDWLAVGDAAAAFDPLSSQGILRALRMGKIAAYTICDALHGRSVAIDKYRLYVESEYAHYRASHRAFYLQENRWPEAPFWARRHHQHGVTKHAHSHV
jgi:flavin-dependent dehydrogenase